MRAILVIAAAILFAACAKKEAPAAAAPPAGDVVAEAPADELAAADEDAAGADAADNAAAEETPISVPAGETGGMCGGFAGFQCLKEADYCAYKEGECVSMADAAGACQPRPEMCTQQYDPVCGCDGKTYGNACTAAAAGVSVASRGECGEGPATE